MSEETAVVTEVKAADTDVKKFVEEVVAEVEKAAPEAKKVEKKIRIDVSVAEKLAIRDIETEWLRAQMQMKALQDQFQVLGKQSQELAGKFKASVAELEKKYGTADSHRWNELGGYFESLEAALRRL